MVHLDGPNSGPQPRQQTALSRPLELRRGLGIKELGKSEKCIFRFTCFIDNLRKLKMVLGTVIFMLKHCQILKISANYETNSRIYIQMLIACAKCLQTMTVRAIVIIYESTYVSVHNWACDSLKLEACK